MINSDLFFCRPTLSLGPSKKSLWIPVGSGMGGTANSVPHMPISLPGIATKALRIFGNLEIGESPPASSAWADDKIFSELISSFQRVFRMACRSATSTSAPTILILCVGSTNVFARNLCRDFFGKIPLVLFISILYSIMSMNSMLLKTSPIRT